MARRKPLRVDCTAPGVHHIYRLGNVELTECCDCGLVHREVVLPDPKDPTIVHIYSWRDEAATARARLRREIAGKES